ncbi:MAG: ECF-type sigma factor [Wenzhouxiangellaceae bacterium]
MSATATDYTQLIRDWQGGDGSARDRLFQAVYPELQRIAQRQLQVAHYGHTLNSTALVHELYAKLYGDHAEYENRSHFMAVAAKAMRHIITDHIRRNHAQKRGGDLIQATLNTQLLTADSDPQATVEILDLLEQLEVLGERFITVVECRLFAGMSEDEIAESLSVSRRTVQRDWAKAVAWMRYRLDHRGDNAPQA